MPDSPHYTDYLNAVAAGANFAIVNRFTMFEQIALAFEEVFNQPLSLVYEISHNLVQRELSPEFGWVHVHRKGATRAFPAGHDYLKGTQWEATGHPVLIPGSNHDSSFILRATPGASISGYSVNHGAGRRMSRGAARKTLNQRQVDDEYRRAGIVVNLHGNVPIDESRDAYKSSREVVEGGDAGRARDHRARAAPARLDQGQSMTSGLTWARSSWPARGSPEGSDRRRARSSDSSKSPDGTPPCPRTQSYRSRRDRPR